MSEKNHPSNQTFFLKGWVNVWVGEWAGGWAGGWLAGWVGGWGLSIRPRRWSSKEGSGSRGRGKGEIGGGDRTPTRPNTNSQPCITPHPPHHHKQIYFQKPYIYFKSFSLLDSNVAFTKQKKQQVS